MNMLPAKEKEQVELQANMYPTFADLMARVNELQHLRTTGPAPMVMNIEGVEFHVLPDSERLLVYTPRRILLRPSNAQHLIETDA